MLILHYQFSFFFFYKIPSLWDQLVKFQSIFNLTNFHYPRPRNILHILCTRRFFFVLIYFCRFLSNISGYKGLMSFQHFFFLFIIIIISVQLYHPGQCRSQKRLNITWCIILMRQATSMMTSQKNHLEIIR